MSSASYRLAGIDIAWRVGNPSAIALGQLQHGILRVDQVYQQHFSVAAMGQLLVTQEVYGVAIDGPTVITNATGMRACERAIVSRYGRRGVACYPANLKLWSDCQSVQLSQWLQHNGYAHAGSQPNLVQQQQWQMECYPHAALLEILQLPYRLAYKKGNIAQRRSGQQRFAELLLGLEQQSQAPIRLQFTPAIRQQLLDDKVIGELRGSALKRNEDCLDALVCVLSAAYHQAQKSQVFGDDESGFIVVPHGDCNKVDVTQAAPHDLTGVA